MCETVSFDLAKKLKEKGFNHKTRCGFLPPIKFVHEAFTDTDWCAKNGYPAPTISQVLKWLREEKRIHIQMCVVLREYYFQVIDINRNAVVCISNGYSSYEIAALAGISWALDNLI